MTRFTSLQAIEAYLAEHTDYERMMRIGYHGRAFNLDRTSALLDSLDRPDSVYLSVHVAGTKGKGSTAHMIEAALRGAGVRTGLFTSPHLASLRERIRIDGELVEEALFCDAVGAVAAVAKKVHGERPTFFEIMTAAAAEGFRRAGVETAVFETGLGGRLDSTNAMVHDVSVITPISLDHTNVLGSTLDAIAAEKAGILSPGRPAVIARQSKEVRRVIDGVIESAGLPAWRIGEDVRLRTEPVSSWSGGPQLRAAVTTPRRDWPELRLPVSGPHQADNLAAALAAVDLIADVDTAGSVTGLESLSLPGRVDLVSRHPMFIVDTAHNVAAVEALLKALEGLDVTGPRCLVFAASSDKDIEGMTGRLAGAFDRSFCTTAGTPRSADPNALALRFTEAGAQACAIHKAPDAFAAAKDAAGSEGLVVVTGSFYIAGLFYNKPPVCFQLRRTV